MSIKSINHNYHQRKQFTLLKILLATMLPFATMQASGKGFSSTGDLIAANAKEQAAQAKKRDEQKGLRFVANKKQWENQILFKADLPGGAVFFTGNSFRYSYYDLERLHDLHEMKHDEKKAYGEKINFHAYDVSFVGATTTTPVKGLKAASTYNNYFLGNDQNKWADHVPVYESISYDDLWTGIDLNIYSKGVTMKYDFVVAAGANAAQVALKFDGVTPTIDAKGDLVIKTSVNTLHEGAPYTYQVINGKKVVVPSKYAVLEDGSIGFDFPKGYDKTAELIIDPTLVFGTYSGGTASTFGWSATYDSTGSLYAGGECFAVGWPVTTGAFQTTFGGGAGFTPDCSINKYTPDGTGLIYSTYYGGSGADLPNTMVVNDQDELIMSGLTNSTNLPTTTGCYDNSYNGGSWSGDIYVMHLNAAGSALIGSTYIGGSADEVSTRGEVLTSGTDIFVGMSTSSTNFPTTTGAYQTANAGSNDGVIFKMDGTCSTLLWSTYLGGNSDDQCYAIVLNNAGDIVATGQTSSTNFPTTAGSLHPANMGGTDGYITILNTTGSAVLQSTFIGTIANDIAYKIQVDPSDNVFVLGTSDGNGYPVTAGMYSNPGAHVFVDKLSSNLSLSLQSTVLGDPNGSLVPSAFLYDVCGNVYVCGQGASFGNYPVTTNAFQTTSGGFWLCVLSQNMSNLLYGTYMGNSGDHNDGGSSRFDPQGIVYHSVCNCGGGFPTTLTAWAPNAGGFGCDIASFKFNFEAQGVIADIDITAGINDDTTCILTPLTFVNNTSGATDYLWDFGDGTTSTLQTPPPHAYIIPGTYTVTLYANNNVPNICFGDDTAYYTLTVLDTIPLIAKAALNVPDTGCIPYPVSFTNTSIGATSYEWDFGDGSLVSNAFEPNHTYTADGNYTIRLIINNPASCTRKDTVTIPINLLNTHPTASINLPQDDTGCVAYTVNLSNTSFDAVSYLWDFGDGTTDVAVNPPPHTYNTPGVYHVVLHAYNPTLCRTEDVDTVTISVFDIAQPVLHLTDTLVCDLGNVPLTAPVISTTNFLKFHWEPASAITGSPDLQTITANGSTTTTFTVTVTDSIGSCKKSNSGQMTMTVFDASGFKAFVDTTICPGDTASLIGVGGDHYAWSPNVNISSINTAATEVWPGTSATYTVTISNDLGCVKERDVRVSLHPFLFVDAGEDQYLHLGDNVLLEVTGTNGNLVVWTPNAYINNVQSTEPAVNPPADMTYAVTVTSPQGCKFTDSVDIDVIPTMVVSAFSPNGDGTNDFFRFLPNDPNVRLVEMSIYDRWGKQVWTGNNISEGWDGTYDGTPATMGVYFYYIDFAIGLKRYQRKGDITLIR